MKKANGKETRAKAGKQHPNTYSLNNIRLFGQMGQIGYDFEINFMPIATNQMMIIAVDDEFARNKRNKSKLKRMK